MFYEKFPAMAEDQEKNTMPMHSVSPTQGHHPHSRCIADVEDHREDDSFEIFLFIHGYGLGTLYLCLAILVLFMFYKLFFTLKRRRPFIVVIHILVLCFAILRVISSMAKGHIADAIFRFFVQLIGDLSIPALTSAYALIVWVMFEITSVRMSRKLQNKVFLTIVIVSHFIFIVVVDIVVGLYNGTCILLLTCQILNVLWGFILTVLLLIATIKLYKMRRQQEDFFRPRAFSKPVLNLATESLASIAFPINRADFKEISSKESVSSPIPAMEAAKVFPFILNVSSPVDEVRSEPQMSSKKRDNGYRLDFRKRGVRPHEKESNTSSFITNVDVENKINEAEISTSCRVAKGTTEKIESESEVNQFHVGGKGISQSNGDTVGIKYYNISDGRQRTSLENCGSNENVNSLPNTSQSNKETPRSQKSDEILKVDNNSNVSKSSYDLPHEMRVNPRVSTGRRQTLSEKRKRGARRSQNISTRKKNPTKKLEIVGILSAILGVAQVLLGFIGTSYIYNPQLVGTRSEPDPLTWLLFITILRDTRASLRPCPDFRCLAKKRFKNDE
ncbi:hypothetical protein HOLleu_38879 [Holothuria leucospilota]|uniref:Proline-rich transmembrane protein 3/4 domain-containing protein n=1 Tax=Holothuria leucospilota TaxID=206669 RepID=A0A9Q0YF07_HOLLE|nr:hypothetical protein HOLleu_38879 [Holothuria leucospilota]